MFSNPERAQRYLTVGTMLASVALLTAMLSACAGKAVRPAAVPPAQPAPAITAAQDPSAAASTISLAGPAANDELQRSLAFADRVRLMPPAELAQEVSRLANPATSFEQLRLALALSQLRQLPELVRAQELLARVLANPDANALHPLARLLAARYGEQRRVEELLDKQNQQTREVQRRLDHTNERLEALKAIERSLSSRPAPVPPARVRPAKP